MNSMVLTAVGVDKMLWTNLPGQEGKGTSCPIFACV